ncbi:hypothetical protein CEXT_542211 [Caerostris extrusa]|uniref:Reverse transcriptase domain-containing protein n=1 Tax=Caerostris extrusa TaxID=172846 RepID=A0AAV4RHD0_CAEEX|nr:hypothetical protein CEXT_542211 [Caerostris extrusa]
MLRRRKQVGFLTELKKKIVKWPEDLLRQAKKSSMDSDGDIVPWTKFFTLPTKHAISVFLDLTKAFNKVSGAAAQMVLCFLRPIYSPYPEKQNKLIFRLKNFAPYKSKFYSALDIQKETEKTARLVYSGSEAF